MNDRINVISICCLRTQIAGGKTLSLVTKKNPPTLTHDSASFLRCLIQEWLVFTSITGSNYTFFSALVIPRRRQLLGTSPHTDLPVKSSLKWRLCADPRVLIGPDRLSIQKVSALLFYFRDRMRGWGHRLGPRAEWGSWKYSDGITHGQFGRLFRS